MFNKKGYTDVSDTIFFVITFVIVALTIGVSIHLFYATQVDIRAQEAKILYGNVVEGIIGDGLTDINSFDIYANANIDKSVVKNGDFYFEIDIKKDGVSKRQIFEGNREFKISCDLPGPKLPKCYDGKIIVGGYEVIIIAGSNSFGRNI